MKQILYIDHISHTTHNLKKPLHLSSLSLPT